MKKLQILFPEPMWQRMRELARREDIPVSEVVRKAIASWLERFPERPGERRRPPTVDAGSCLLSAEEMKEALHE